jgi:hypothetical protein
LEEAKETKANVYPFCYPSSIYFLSLCWHFFRSEPPPDNVEGGDAGAPPTEGETPGHLTDADLESNWDEAIETFDAMEIPEELLRGIYSYGFEKPSAIQQRAIKPVMLGRDLIAQAQSGTVSSLLDGCVISVLLCFDVSTRKDE